MSRPLFIGLALLLALHVRPAAAQIRLSLEVDPAVALQYELLQARLTILNNTGDPLTLSTNGNCRIRYVIRDQSGVPVSRVVPDAMAWHDVEIAPSLSAVVTNRLNELYHLGEPGSFVVEAEIEWNGLSFSPQRKYLDIVPGITIAELQAGVPGGRGTRSYMLRSLNRNRQDRLFLRIDDPAGGLCYGVFDLGRHLRMEKPTLRVDGSGFLHILHQSGPYEHTYSVFTPNGDLDRHEVYSGEYKVVRLKTLTDGTVEVHEGASGELPPPRMPDTISSAPRKRKEVPVDRK